jgi:GMP synthase-like glutamine amidotransferase
MVAGLVEATTAPATDATRLALERPLLVVQHDPDKPLGRIAQALVALGAQLDVRSAADELPDPAGYAGLIVLPGLADPVDDDPPIRRARRTIEQALSAELPVLGLCLGGQLLAQVLGGGAYRSRSELGFREVWTTAEAGGDPLLGGAPDRFQAFHAHAYAFTAPAGASVLLENEVCVQACRLGEAWAFQCHPEVTPEWVRGLAAGIRGDGGPLLPGTAAFFRENRIDADALERDLAAAEHVSGRVAASIAHGFAERCAAAG